MSTNTIVADGISSVRGTRRSATTCKATRGESPSIKGGVVPGDTIPAKHRLRKRECASLRGTGNHHSGNTTYSNLIRHHCGSAALASRTRSHGTSRVAAGITWAWRRGPGITQFTKNYTAHGWGLLLCTLGFRTTTPAAALTCDPFLGCPRCVFLSALCPGLTLLVARLIGTSPPTSLYTCAAEGFSYATTVLGCGHTSKHVGVGIHGARRHTFFTTPSTSTPATPSAVDAGSSNVEIRRNILWAVTVPRPHGHPRQRGETAQQRLQGLVTRAATSWGAGGPRLQQPDTEWFYG